MLNWHDLFFLPEFLLNSSKFSIVSQIHLKILKNLFTFFLFSLNQRLFSNDCCCIQLYRRWLCIEIRQFSWPHNRPLDSNLSFFQNFSLCLLCPIISCWSCKLKGLLLCTLILLSHLFYFRLSTLLFFFFNVLKTLAIKVLWNGVCFDFSFDRFGLLNFLRLWLCQIKWFLLCRIPLFSRIPKNWLC